MPGVTEKYLDARGWWWWWCGGRGGGIAQVGRAVASPARAR